MSTNKQTKQTKQNKLVVLFKLNCPKLDCSSLCWYSVSDHRHAGSDPGSVHRVLAAPDDILALCRVEARPLQKGNGYSRAKQGQARSLKIRISGYCYYFSVVTLTVSCWLLYFSLVTLTVSRWLLLVFITGNCYCFSLVTVTLLVFITGYCYCFSMVAVTVNFLTGYCFSLVTVTINFIIMERTKERRWLLLLIGYCYNLSLVTLFLTFLLFLTCYYYYFSLFTFTVSHCLGSLFFAWVFVLTLRSYHCTSSITQVTCPKKQAH